MFTRYKFADVICHRRYHENKPVPDEEFFLTHLAVNGKVQESVQIESESCTTDVPLNSIRTP